MINLLNFIQDQICGTIEKKQSLSSNTTQLRQSIYSMISEAQEVQIKDGHMQFIQKYEAAVMHIEGEAPKPVHLESS